MHGNGFGGAELPLHEVVGVEGEIGRVVPQVSPDTQHGAQFRAYHGAGEGLKSHRALVADAVKCLVKILEVNIAGPQVAAMALANVHVDQLVSTI